MRIVRNGYPFLLGAIMTKNKKRYCDGCNKEMPKLLDFSDPEINPHDLLALGFKTKTGKTINKTYDLCSNCMDLVDELLRAK